MHSLPKPDLEIVLPVHNEGESIEAVISEMYAVLSAHLRVKFIVCEDGSKDDTKGILCQLSKQVPMTLIMSDERYQ